MGASGAECPRDSSMLLEFDNSADGQFGVSNFGTFEAHGLSRTAGKDVWLCRLNTDEAAGQTILGVDTDTGWLNGDDIGIAPTSRTYSQGELRTLSGAAAATTVTVSAGITHAHSGTAPTQAEVVLLTRNVRIESVSSTNMMFFTSYHLATLTTRWAQWRYLGQNATNKRGVELWTTTGGSVDVRYCCVRDSEWSGFTIAHATAANNYTIDSTACWQIVGAPPFQQLAATTGTAWMLTNCFVCNAGGTSVNGIQLADLGGVVTNNIVTGMGLNGYNLSEVGVRATGTFDGNTAHSNNGYGFGIQYTIWGLRLTNVVAWRNNSVGVLINSGISDSVISGTFFGNNPASIQWGSSGWTSELTLRVVSNGDSSFATTHGVDLSPMTYGCVHVILDNCNFSTAGGIKTAHTQDVNFSASGRQFVKLVCRNTIMAAATEVSNKTALVARSYIARQRSDGTVNAHSRDYPALGVVAYETGTFRTAAPAEKLTPNGATADYRLRSSVRLVPVTSGKSATISCYVRKDASYTGSAARLIVLANPSLGLDADLVLASMTGPAGTWEQLSGTVTPAAEEDGAYEACVEVDGSAGNVYVDDWAVSLA
jgi:hypothetical protein